MADINAQVAAQSKPTELSHSKGERAEEDDHVADYINARQRNTLAMGAAVAAQGYGSDEEVYATAAAMDAAAGYVDEAVLFASANNMQLLPPVDHDAIQYPEFCKEFYEV